MGGGVALLHPGFSAAAVGGCWPNQPDRRLSDTALAVHIKAVFAEMKGLGFGRMPRILRRLRYG